MTERSERIMALLIETERAHAAYEADELGGSYDHSWPSWYANHAIEHGLRSILGAGTGAAAEVDAEMDAESLAKLLSDSWEEFQRADPTSRGSWASAAAGRIDQLGRG